MIERHMVPGQAPAYSHYCHVVRADRHVWVSGAVGVARDGSIALRDANAVPLAQRQAVSGLVAAENGDRGALYREIARANGHPEWEAEVRNTFAQRWADKAQGGWFVQGASGQWARK